MLNNAVDNLYLPYLYKSLRSTMAEYAIFSSMHGVSSLIDNM